MKFKINGMHCDACKMLIEMELQENGISGVDINKDSHELSIPPELTSKADDIKAIINSMSTYGIEE